MARGKSSGALFVHEARKEGRTVAVFRGIAAPDGTVTVETDVYPVSAPPDAEPQRRPYPFGSRQLAEKFTEEALLALEYLGCTVTE